jgi:hypothetical protein
MLVKYYDKLLFVLGLALLGASYWFFGRISPESGNTVLVGTRVEEHKWEPVAVPTIEAVRWADAKAQPAGPKWIYDLFTPPLIFLDPTKDQLTPEPPKAPEAITQGGPSPFPFVLVDISRDLYRIQLSGFFGQAPDYRVTLEDRDTGMPLIGRPGTKFERSNVEIKSFNVERRTVDAGGTPLVEEVATAVILDTLSNEEVTLSYPGEPRYLPTPKAEFRTRDEVPVNFVLRPGESRKIGDFSFAVREITLDPKQAVVVREASGDIPELRRELTPTPKEELPTERPPTIQGGAPSTAPFMNNPQGGGPPGMRPGQARPGGGPPPGFVPPTGPAQRRN